MKKIALSALAALTIGTISAIAGDIKLYADANGQVFTTPADGRTELNNSSTEVQAKTSKLKFSGTHYLGFNYNSPKGGDATGNFEMRRNYVQVKAYLMEDPKSYLRVTLDATYSNKTANGEGHADVYVKYAYIYLNNVLPATGVEFGMVHRPWIDYEEHQGWWMRSIAKVFVEASESAHLTNSADLGVNFKTKTPYFTSEVGIFNGEGYHGSNDDNGATNPDYAHIGAGISAEWRTTVAAFGNGDVKRKPKKDTYFDASFFGQYNMNNSKNANKNNKEKDYMFYGLHAVYNMPSLLVAAQYVSADNDLVDTLDGRGTSEYNGAGYSLNATYRIGEDKEYSILARYDVWTSQNEHKSTEQTTNSAIYGVAWQQNKNLKWLLSGQSYVAKDDRNYKGSNTTDWTSAMLTAEVHW